MNLIDVYSVSDAAATLRQLLAEREPHQNISHRRMPTLQEHHAFIASRPYAAWYLIESDPDYVGAIYLTHQREIGVGVLRKWQRLGYAEQAVRAIMLEHPGRFLANINPANEASIALFRKLGFGGPIQITLEKPE